MASKFTLDLTYQAADKLLELLKYQSGDNSELIKKIEKAKVTLQISQAKRRQFKKLQTTVLPVNFSSSECRVICQIALDRCSHCHSDSEEAGLFIAIMDAAYEFDAHG